MPSLLDLLPCNRVPIYQCLNGSCNQCIKLFNEVSSQPELVEIDNKIESIRKPLIPTI